MTTPRGFSKKQLAKFGITYAELVLAKRRYSTQRQHAKRRGIEFKFTFDDWLAWWIGKLGPVWLSKRGRLSEKFCMARRDDEGPYHPDNVMCITIEQNGHDKAKTGAVSYNNRHHTKLHAKQVLKIYKSRKPIVELAQKYSVQPSTIKLIKQRKIWRDVTNR